VLSLLSNWLFDKGEAPEFSGAFNKVSETTMPAPMFPHGEQVFVRLPKQHLFDVN